MQSRILDLIRTFSPAGYDFWFSGSTFPDDLSWQSHADIIYALRLSGQLETLNRESAQIFADRLACAKLYGKPGGVLGKQRAPGAHMTAYLLAAHKLLDDGGYAQAPRSLYSGWTLDALVDDRLVPIWPQQWTHHIWRVSHWIGGTPSILLNLASTSQVASVDVSLVHEVLDACEKHILVPETGLLRPYKSKILQQLFRKAYALRHDPDVSDIGGIVHLLWIYHALKRPYIGAEHLYQQSYQHMQQAPFIESMPYCLDFDIVQLVRTAAAQVENTSLNVKPRAFKFGGDIAGFLNAPLPASYTLHKLPGALATLHECAFITQSVSVQGLNIPPVDIIEEAFWL